jgi:hypothetical protein
MNFSVPKKHLLKELRHVSKSASFRFTWPIGFDGIGLGLTWLATAPPIAAVVGTMFGTRYHANLFGLKLLSHRLENIQEPGW